jgi:hypothetical protein
VTYFALLFSASIERTIIFKCPYVSFLQVRAYDTLNIKHEPLDLIPPSFKVPLPPLQPAVFLPGKLSFPFHYYVDCLSLSLLCCLPFPFIIILFANCCVLSVPLLPLQPAVFLPGMYAFTFLFVNCCVALFNLH